MIRMRPPLPAERLILDILQLSRESGGYKEFLSKFGDYSKAKLEINEVIIKDSSQRQALNPVDETALNTGKPYIENGISGYSATEMIEYSNKGYKCCAVLPISKDGKSFGTITLLSKDEVGFEQEYMVLLSIAASVISSEASSKYERDKSFNVAKYFDASFNNMMPQFLVNTEGGIIKANKSAMNYFDRSQKELSSTRLSDIFDLDAASLEKLKRGSLIESYGKMYQGRIFEISPSKVNESLIHLMINEVSEAKGAEEKVKLLDRSSDEVFMTLDKNLQISWVSNASDSLFGVHGNMIAGRKFTDFVTVPNTMADILQKLANNKYSGQIKLSFGNEVETYANLMAYKSGDDFYCIISKDYKRLMKFAEDMTQDMVRIIQTIPW